MDVVNAKFKKDSLEKDIEALAVRYKKQMKERLHGMEQTVSEFLSSSYKELLQKHPEEMAKRFPNITYGMKPGSTAEQKAYP